GEARSPGRECERRENRACLLNRHGRESAQVGVPGQAAQEAVRRRAAYTLDILLEYACPEPINGEDDRSTIWFGHVRLAGDGQAAQFSLLDPAHRWIIAGAQWGHVETQRHL